MALLKSAGHDGPLLYPGPLCSGERVEDQPGGWFAWMLTSLASVHGWTVDKPRSPTADLADRMSARRVSGVLFLFGYFLFEHAKRK